MFSAMLTDASTKDDLGLDVRYRTDGKLFNPRRLKAQTKVSHTKICDLLFANNYALNATSDDNFSVECDNFRLTIGTKKTEVLLQPLPGTVCSDPIMKVKDSTLQSVDTFTYVAALRSASG
jgi:hypothetical protein